MDYLKASIDSLLPELISKREIYNKNIGLFFWTKFQKWNGRIFYELIALSETLKGYWNNIKIFVNLDASLDENKKFLLIFRPYKNRPNHLHKLLTIVFPEHKDNCKIYFSFYLNLGNTIEETNSLGKIKGKKEIYLALPTYIFFQVYDKKDMI